LQAQGAMDPGPDERQGPRLAPAEEVRRVRRRDGADRALSRIGALGPDDRRAARRREPGADAAPPPERAQGAARRDRPARRSADARDPRRRDAVGRVVALRDQVRRGPRPRLTRRRRDRASWTERPGRHDPLPRGGRRAASSPAATTCWSTARTFSPPPASRVWKAWSRRSATARIPRSARATG